MLSQQTPKIMNKSLWGKFAFKVLFYTTHALDPLPPSPPHTRLISKLYRVGEGDLQGICQENSKALRRIPKIKGNYEYCITVP